MATFYEGSQRLPRTTVAPFHILRTSKSIWAHGAHDDCRHAFSSPDLRAGSEGKKGGWCWTSFVVCEGNYSSISTKFPHPSYFKLLPLPNKCHRPCIVSPATQFPEICHVCHLETPSVHIGFLAMTGKHVVVSGGGVAGSLVAKLLQDSADVTLVDR